jgi:hypothetical protein
MKQTCAVDCEYCKHNLAVSLPDDLIAATLSGDLVVFAGAGISTENRSVLRHTLYDEIRGKLETNEDLSFPEAMQKFCAKPNGRIRLIEEIRARFDNIDSFPELEAAATRFHRSLGTLFLVSEIVTTNWDTYFERYCHALPFVDGEDTAFWGAHQRKVLKIHGSIDKLSSIVATSDDYKACEDRLSTGLIGGILKNLLATKTLVFVGYSLRDDDFLQIRAFVGTQLKQFKRHAYLVTPFEDASHESLESDGFTVLKTDGAFFVEQLKGHIRRLGPGLLSDEVFEIARSLRLKVAEEHHKLHAKHKISKLPELIYAASYQDGLAHSLERALAMRGSGQYSHACRLRNVARSYDQMLPNLRKAKRFADVAYVEGYLNGLIFLISAGSDKKPMNPPLYFAFGAQDIFSLTAFSRLFQGGAIPHKAARRYATRMIAEFSVPSQVEFHHPPWL